MKRFRGKVEKKKGKKGEKQMVLDKQGNGKGAHRRPDYLMV